MLIRPTDELLELGRAAAVLRDRAGDRGQPLRAVPLADARPSRATRRRPSGIALDTPAQIDATAALIRSAAVDSHAMPLGNATGMTQAERDTLARWLASR